MKPEKIKGMISDVQKILEKVQIDQKQRADAIRTVHPNHAKSARNLIQYLSLRSFDLRSFQKKLGYLGMSRLARAESHVDASLRSALFYMKKLVGEPAGFPTKYTLSIKASEKLLKKNTEVLLGKRATIRRLRIMVTMPTEAAENYELVEGMVKQGMDVARINCAHDTPEIWTKMIRNIRKAGEADGREIKVTMDLNGPKIRTGHLDKPFRLFKGDYLKLCKEPIHGYPAVVDDEGKVTEPATVSCTLPEAFKHLRVSDFVYLDDGEIKGLIEEVRRESVLIRIIRASEKGSKLRPDKGINFPDAVIPIQGLTELDKKHLKFIAEHADLVNFSYVNTCRDVSEMIRELNRLGVQDKIGIILKIETQTAYNNLIRILLEAMKYEKIGVMIARGDLAVEAGWRRMGGIQREMLAICNACHIPVVWATQVMENLAKKGYPSRSEITDAVNASKADCVMLNKGPYIIKAIELLDQIIVNSEMHQDKNAPMLPKLRRIKPKHSFDLVEHS